VIAAVVVGVYGAHLLNLRQRNCILQSIIQRRLSYGNSQCLVRNVEGSDISRWLSGDVFELSLMLK
jgi:hypothetical protein